jgi:hypothetical protein
MSPPAEGPGILLRLYKHSQEPLMDSKIYVPGANITKIKTLSPTDDKVARLLPYLRPTEPTAL